MQRYILKWMEWDARAKHHWQDDDAKCRPSNVNLWADPQIIADLMNMATTTQQIFGRNYSA